VAILYKVVETSDVTDVELERILNEWTRQGWSLDTIQFAMREASKHSIRNASSGATPVQRATNDG
jgi:hypothetical protein